MKKLPVAIFVVLSLVIVVRLPGPATVHAQPAAVLDRAVELASKGASLMPPDQLRRWAPDAVTGASATRVDAAAMNVIRRAEKAFILDPSASSLDLIPEPDRTRFKDFQWDPDDYPGGPVGPHEEVALAQDAALSRIRAERRANSTATAVVRESEFNNDVWKYIESEERVVPGQERFKLNRWALASFIAMREAAKRDGVDIVILSSNRLPATAAQNATRESNSYAVARFSSHILGLAMDIQLRDVALAVSETSTRPMSNVIAMRRSRAHKWMFLRGAAFGWYPYQHEPWHWEYNPPGFRERFWNGYTGKRP
ncbi:MAG TPA: D-alanyl-D-alanine carboxypeptidase family protein [Armatimonadota bacterium]|jgi:hypothetical protein